MKASEVKLLMDYFIKKYGDHDVKMYYLCALENIDEYEDIEISFSKVNGEKVFVISEA